MSCQRESVIVRLVGGELAEAEEREVRLHLAACTTCAEAFEGLRGTWDELGAWNVDPTEIDLTDRVLARVTEPEDPTRHQQFFSTYRGASLRVAASIALAAGLGIATGAMVPRDPGLKAAQFASAPSPVELVEALGLAELSTPSATGLPLGFETEAPEGAEVGP